ncbi:MAG: ABC transporter substrate-binding protein [Spirochaetes bacterium]|nr:ABC transporter substrate-binding protein [Spirochaetota bacterium]
MTRSRFAALLAALALLAACVPEKPAPGPAGRINRVVSLSPSISRQIVDLGAKRLLVGVTSYDDIRGGGIDVVGTLVQPNFERIIMLKPDVVFHSAEDGLVQNIDRISGAGVASYRFGRNRNFDDICDNYLELASLLGLGREGRRKIAGYRDRLGRVRQTAGAAERPIVVFLVACRPLIVASAHSFIGRIIHDAGGRPAYDDGGRAHPPVSIESVIETDPDVIIAMTGGDDTREFFSMLSRDFRRLKAVAGGRLYDIPPDTIPYYTPADYLASVERISGILEERATAR